MKAKTWSKSTVYIFVEHETWKTSVTWLKGDLIERQALEVGMQQDASLHAVGKAQRPLTVLLLDVAQDLDQLSQNTQVHVIPLFMATSWYSILDDLLYSKGSRDSGYGF